MSNNKIQPTNSQFILYQDDNGVTNINVRFDDEDVWLSQQQIAMLFDTTQQNISLHINSIIEEVELLKEATHKYFLLVRQEGNRSVKRQIEHYNLDMIIAVGYRVKSQVATRFRQWATQWQHEYIKLSFRERITGIEQQELTMQQTMNRKIEQIEKISKAFNLGLKVEIVQPSDNVF